ncbi:DUF4145 domain-containing protein [Aerococcus agrisoli]|uniref:DUF4145 domain-containing protein n=1 Tax=Aerococcus agrisoli TaxID=2487350 RepID=A0A3N4FZ64_9LACT|nr:DUF4145 domain-containing protein [Aerococcus agrisoli]RPA55535.1 DUF4145 domain-containing protein [Aerococcus agrisoli]
MLKDVVIKFRDSSPKISLDIPNHCPHCGKIMIPHIHEGASEFNHGDSKRIIGILAQCADVDCKKFFALSYKYNPTSQYPGSYLLENYTYSVPINVSLPENIEKVSSKFVEIYKQSVEAESSGLDQIAGVGYRKATEFLIKDYAIRVNSEDKEKIENMFLGKVIDDYLNDFQKLQNLARASTWIGNDETHYVRRHENKDINDMKKFILSAAQFIAADYDADEALNFIS